jgi:anti-sigma regulatory factor (Ser/Thr protein kinase)
VREVLVSWHLEALADTAMLLASELVTNAIRHAGSRFEIVLEQLPVGGFRLAVSDAAAGDWPRVNHAADDDEGGRGMWLVDKLSNSWGTTSGRGGKTVWFELLLDQPLAEKGAV